MLILRRKAGETLHIGGNVEVTVVEVSEGSVRLAIEAPKEITILRGELVAAAEINRDAANEQAQPQGLVELLKKPEQQA